MTDRRFPAPGLARRLLAPIAALLGLVAGLSVLILPSPAPTTADPTEFSAERAMTSINRLADEPHSVLRREAHDRARDDVIGMFTDLGYTPTVHSDPMFDLSDPADKRIFDGLSAEQQATLKDAPTDTIVVDVPGKSERTMALMAHYDSATVEADENGHQQITDGTSLGAADDGYGVAAIVETLRALKAEGRQPENSLKIVITDAEEIGLIGARNEMRHHRADYENVDLVLNLEARGTSGPALMFETSPNNSAVAGYFLSHVEQPATGSLLPSLYARMPNTTDMAALIPEGFTVLNIAAIGEAEHYHHATDAPRYVDHSTLQHYGDQVLGLTRAWAFDGQAPTLTADGDLHFFQLWRGMTVHYPAAVGTGLGCLAIIAAIGAVAVRARSLRWKRVLGSVWGLTWRAAFASAVAGLVQLGAMAMKWAPESGLGPNPLLVGMFAGGTLIGVGLTVHFVVRRWKEGLGQEAVAAVLLLLAAVCVPLMVLVSGAAYVLVLPTLALALTTLAPRRVRPVVGALAAFVIVAILAPAVLLIHEMLSLSAVWVTVFFAIVPVAPLALVLLQAGSRRTQRTTARTSSSSDATLDGAGGPATATA
ncbi:M20/M25/M40 family metallo-hydrolase [Actinomyces sp. oral taxon 171]|uniref:M20/M25/M40 family metallo-hydrolase n=1 Tax=Actinomyces sp. oral taxon 171 TaxID=706438 RepID=UPI0001F6234B|nr:M20/M25/M40 family metallo-hydrolase [Actinomyces sp. oral taxon 171]EFW28275.1 peptidase, M28 family [Actinomyces sp. oral taxon 171 str. F0337]QCT34189.1 M20/M25/M40 family metallo-hydrolase [Actinomyces sp. oral taxon 171 str. F0337]